MGKKHRRGKNISTELKDLPDELQFFGYVNKILGSGCVNLDYYVPIYDDNSVKVIDWTKHNKIGIIRGKMRRRVWINLNDIVLVTERDFDTKKVDIIDKYDTSQLAHEHMLIKYSIIPPINELSENGIEFGHVVTEFNNSINDSGNNITSFSDEDINDI